MKSENKNSECLLEIENVQQIPQLSPKELFNNQYKEIRVQMQNLTCTNIQESGFYQITNFLKKISPNKLEVLLINLECSEGLAEKLRYTFEEIFELRKALSPLMKKLKVFQLNLNNWGYQNLGLMPDSCFPRFFTDIYQQMEMMEELTINLKSIDHNNSTTKITLFSIIENIKFDKLRKLSIDIEHPINIFAQNRFQPSQFEAMFQKIVEKGKSLQSLKLNVNRFNLSMRSFQILIEGLKNFENLEEIGLYLLQKNEIENEEIIESYTELIKIIFNLPKIKFIELQHGLHSIEQINIQFIQNLTNLLDQKTLSMKIVSFKLKIASANYSQSDIYLKFLIKYGRIFGRGHEEFPFVMRMGDKQHSIFQKAYYFGVASRIQTICMINQIQKYLSKFRSDIIYDIHDKCF
ncbi:hypothetical protein TTHERM_00335920 (macronuclear) [Tetrahymena thermophila SB210]|uniref:Kinase domain protein n=1 Tax=Tetrahymena thermophila (strain SB210) TaxID=312017 RepID=I7MJY5_TETTS|nr:hypothetical protein TTHERM_00335920 [Tetrahymena thermophila SB210]EAR97313.2 hypothetical protein TTHERM_00335920 [Tetrahymena thermophila SB210]|eukprot:XP_001017558.2 hypothetical protein TTHERM_00335920 [Tetrahymena thermophila SB210]